MNEVNYKQGKLVLPVKEFLIEKGVYQYEINGIEMGTSVVLYKEELGIFKVMPKGDFQIIGDTNNQYLKIVNEKVFETYLSIQIVSIKKLISSIYEPSSDIDINTMLHEMNNVIQDVHEITDYLKKTNQIVDSEKATNVFPDLPIGSTVIRLEDGTLGAIPISDMYEHFDRLTERIYDTVTGWLETDHQKFIQEMKEYKDELEKALNELSDKLANDLQVLFNQKSEEFKQHIDDDLKPILLKYVNEVLKPELKSYTETLKVELNTYTTVTLFGKLDTKTIECINKIEAKCNECISKLNTHTEDKKKELDSRTVKLKGDLNTHSEVKKQEISTHAIEVKNNLVVEITKEGTKQKTEVIETGDKVKEEINELIPDNLGIRVEQLEKDRVLRSGDSITGTLNINMEGKDKVVLKSGGTIDGVVGSDSNGVIMENSKSGLGVRLNNDGVGIYPSSSLKTESKELTEAINEVSQNLKDTSTELRNNKLDKVNTIEELKSQNLKVGDIIEVLGYYQAGDGAGHKRIISNEDDGSGIQLSNGLWANIVHNGEVNVSWFGAKGDGVTDDTQFIKKSNLPNVNIINFNRKKYRVTDNIITSNRGIILKGNGASIFLDSKVKVYLMQFDTTYEITKSLLENVVRYKDHIKIDLSEYDVSDKLCILKSQTVFYSGEARRNLTGEMVIPSLYDDVEKILYLKNEDPFFNYKTADTTVHLFSPIKGIVIEDFNFIGSGIDYENVFINLNKCFQPIVRNCTASKSLACFGVTESYQPIFESNIFNNIDKVGLGYGVMVGTFNIGTIIQNNRGYAGRHFVTTTAENGISKNTVIQNNVFSHSIHGAIDTHVQGVNTVIQGNTIYTSNIAISVRSMYATVKGNNIIVTNPVYQSKPTDSYQNISCILTEECGNFYLNIEGNTISTSSTEYEHITTSVYGNGIDIRQSKETKNFEYLLNELNVKPNVNIIGNNLYTYFRNGNSIAVGYGLFEKVEISNNHINGGRYNHITITGADRADVVFNKINSYGNKIAMSYDTIKKLKISSNVLDIQAGNNIKINNVDSFVFEGNKYSIKTNSYLYGNYHWFNYVTLPTSGYIELNSICSAEEVVQLFGDNIYKLLVSEYSNISNYCEYYLSVKSGTVSLVKITGSQECAIAEGNKLKFNIPSGDIYFKLIPVTNVV